MERLPGREYIGSDAGRRRKSEFGTSIQKVPISNLSLSASANLDFWATSNGKLA
jgi:hypothetical protein